jgi:hypothetical protein
MEGTPNAKIAGLKQVRATLLGVQPQATQSQADPGEFDFDFQSLKSKQYGTKMKVTSHWMKTQREARP